MADNPLPRLKTSYLLGLSNKPFKDPPKPPPLNSYRGMLKTPGAAIEWAASDGRRGRLIGKGKPRLLSALGAATTVKCPANSGARANQGAAEKDAQATNSTNEANIETSGQTVGGGEVEYKKGVPNELFTEEEDEILMRMKTEDAQWGAILEKLKGKSKKQCNQRFNEIRPDDFWEKKNASKKNGKEGNQKQEKKKEKIEASGGDAWDMSGLGFLGEVDDKKSEASHKGEIGVVDAGGWGGAEWAVATDTNTGGNAAWEGTGSGNGGGVWFDAGANAPTGGDTKTGGWPSDGGDAWKSSDDNTGIANAGKEDSKNDKKEERNNQGNNDKGNEKSDKKASAPNVAADPWSAGDGVFAISGGGATTGWADNDDKNSSTKHKTANSPSSSKSSSNKTWDADEDNKGDAGGTFNWGPTNGGWNADPTRGDNNAETGAAMEFAGWGGAASTEKGNSKSKEKSKKKDKLSNVDLWSNTWATPTSPQKPASRASSCDREKHRSSRYQPDAKKDKHESHRHHSSSHPAEYKVAPDHMFSQNELKLIARILQQDCSMVWERVSWRFKDKTGRNLHPDTFEKKITGKLEKERRH